MKYKISLIIPFFLLLLISEMKAQGYNSDWKKTEKDKKESRKFSNNFYVSIGFTPFVSIYNIAYADDFVNSTQSGMELRVDRDKIWTIIEAQIDLRYNLFNYRDFFSISTTFSPQYGLLDAGPGLSIINLPISLDLNFYCHSTFNNIDNLGFALSGGFQPHNMKTKTFYDYGDNIKWNDIFFRFTLKYRKYKSTFSPKFNPKKSHHSYFAFQYGFSTENVIHPTTNISEAYKFTHFKIVFGKILRY